MAAILSHVSGRRAGAPHVTSSTTTAYEPMPVARTPARTRLAHAPHADAACGRSEAAVRIAHSAADRQAVYALRYRVYVEELGLRQTYADHDRKIVQDPLDTTAIVLLAAVDDEVIGTVRTNIVSNGNLERYAELHRLYDLRGIDLSRVTMTSKLIVDARHRTGRVMSKLAHTLFGIGVACGILIDFIDCEKRLLPFYERFGYRRTSKQPFEHPELGPRYPMCLWTDGTYLRSVRSSLVRSLP